MYGVYSTESEPCSHQSEFRGVMLRISQYSIEILDSNRECCYQTMRYTYRGMMQLYILGAHSDL